VALATADQAELEGIAEKLSSLQLPYARIVESHGEYAGQLMAIGVQPLGDRDQIRKVVSYLPLVK